MTALLDSPSSPPATGPASADQPADLTAAGASSALLTRAAAWLYLVQVTSLAAVYGVGVAQDERHVRRAAAVGLAVSWAVATAAVSWLVAVARSRPATQVPGRMRRLPALLLLAVSWLVLLVSAVDLTVDGDATGAWVLLATATPALLVLAACAAITGRRSVDQRGEHWPTTKTRTNVLAGETASDTEAVDTSAATGVGSETDAVTTVGEADAVERPERSPVVHRLVADDVAATLSTGYAVAIDGGFWEAAQAALTPRGGSHHEQGGVALTTRVGKTLLVLGAVFARQMTATPTYCEFSTLDVDRVRRSLDDLDADLDSGCLAVTWIHTHPRLGVFLSATDHETARQWRALDPLFTPIVVDASKPRLDEQLGVFDGDGHQLLPLKQVEGLVDPAVAERVRQTIVRTYQADGQPEPLVLLGKPARHENRSQATARGQA